MRSYIQIRFDNNYLSTAKAAYYHHKAIAVLELNRRKSFDDGCLLSERCLTIPALGAALLDHHCLLQPLINIIHP